jgi:hypothetical protein
VRRRNVDGGGFGGANTVRAEAEERVGDVVGHRQHDDAVEAVMADGEAKESGSDGGGFNVVKFGEDSDEAMELVNVGALYPVVVNDEAKMNVASDMCEQARLSLVTPVVFEKLDYALMSV